MKMRSLFLGPAFAALCACSGMSAQTKHTDAYQMDLARCNQVEYGMGKLPVRDPVTADKPGWAYHILRRDWSDENRTTSCFGQIFNNGGFRCECSVMIPSADKQAGPDDPMPVSIDD
jgi:hypothetical protein